MNYLEEYNVLNTTIHGHDGEGPDGDHSEPDGGNDDPGIESTSYHSSVEVVTPENAIRMEKCIVFTHSLMSLITSLHGGGGV